MDRSVQTTGLSRRAFLAATSAVLVGATWSGFAPYAVAAKRHPQWNGTLQLGARLDPAGLDSHDRHQQDGQWTPARQKLHGQINQKLRGHVPAAPPGEKSYLMMGGGPASGKSSVIQAGLVKLPEHHVMIDSDAIKGELPEYRALIDSRDDRAASYAHEESSHIGKIVNTRTLAAYQVRAVTPDEKMRYIDFLCEKGPAVNG